MDIGYHATVLRRILLQNDWITNVLLKIKGASKPCMTQSRTSMTKYNVLPYGISVTF